MIRMAATAATLGVTCALALSAAGLQQSPVSQTRTALILGQVVDGSNDRPMSSVVVTLNVPAAMPVVPTGFPTATPPVARAITDSNGRFVFNELPAGRYAFSISTASGQLIGGYGMRRPGGTTQPFELVEGQRVGDVTLRAWKYGSVGGTVLDRYGDPIVETRVTLLRAEIVAGHRRYRVGPTTMTDDRGMYRISRVEPGEYTTYLPYSQVTVPVDVDRAGTDISTQLVPGFQISGRVVGIEGPAPIITVRLVAQNATDADNEDGVETAKTVTNATGEFTFLGVPSGSYLLRVARVPSTTRPTTMTAVTVGGTTMFTVVDDSNLPPLPLPEAPTESQSMPLVIGDQDIRSLTVQLQRGPRLSGRLAYDGSSPQLTADQLVRATINLDSIDGRVFPGATGKGQFEANGQFRTLGLLPGRYMIRLGGNLAGWSVDSVSVGGKNLPDQPIAIADTDISGVVVTLTDRAGSIGGSVRDGRGAGTDPNAAVLVFPASSALWQDTTANPRRLKSTRVSTRGTYQIDNLPAGDYIVVAIDDRFTADWQRPQRLESLARLGTRVTFSAADRKTLDLTTQVLR